jgi:uncharacterized protein (DUF58 family)
VLRGKSPVESTRRLRTILYLLLPLLVVLPLLGYRFAAVGIAGYFLVVVALCYSYVTLISSGTSCNLADTSVGLSNGGATLKVELELSCRPTCYGFEVSLDLPPQLVVEASTYRAKVVFTETSGRLVLNVPIARRTGLHVVGPLVVAAVDPLGLFKGTVYVKESLVVRIPPEVATAPLARWYGIMRASSGARTLTPGHGLEYHSTRDYEPGDELRVIDWKATARIGKLFVKTFEVETPIKVFLLVDALPHMFAGGPKTLFEYCADLTVAIANYLLRRGDTVEVAVVSEDGVRRSGELRSVTKLHKVLEVLANVRWPRTSPYTVVEPRPMSKAIEALQDSLASASVVVVLTSTLGSNVRLNELEALHNFLRGHGNELLVIIPIASFFSAKSPVEDSLYRVLRFGVLSREVRSLESLRKLNLKVIALTPSKALEKAIAELEKLRRTKVL